MHLDLHLLLVALQRDLHPPLLLVNQWVLARDLNLDLELRLPLSLMVDMQWDPRDQRETVNQIIPQHNLHDQSNLYIGRIGKIGAVIQNRKGSDRKRKVQAEQVIW